ncbi:MAG TPA: alpha/beta fold hydrolase [Thermoanaerobaculia bacterium]|nr:alpha/beta fold hydrolase [Thermoanaerobaculia bacterium]
MQAAGCFSTLVAVLALGSAVGAVAVPASATVPAGWQRFDLPATGSYLWRYVPSNLDQTRKAPLVVFLHGAGGTPDAYMSYVFPAADRAGCVVVLPKSSSNVGWGTATDRQIVSDSLTLVSGQLSVDADRIAIAGHSAGGAYAYLLAYGTVGRFSAVFSMSAPFYSVQAVADPAYKAPIRMYYGTTDPNYTGGAHDRLVQQWDALGITWQEDVEAGFGHNFWPPDSMANGFLFLVSKTYSAASCIADATHLCLQQARFRVEVAWRDGSGASGPGTVTPAVSADSGVLWFFAPSNWEMLVKVLDGCGVNHHIWVFVAATTNVQYTLTVTDTVTGKAKSYQNPSGQTSPVITDTSAFDSCP